MSDSSWSERPRRGARRILWIAAGLLIVGAAVAAALPRWVDLEGLRPGIEAQLSSATGRGVSVGSLRLALWPWPGVRASGLRVGPPLQGGGGEAADLEATSVLLHPSLLRLLRGRFEVRSFSARGGRLRVGGRPVLEEASLDGRLAAAGERRDIEGTLRGTFVELPKKPTGKISFACGLDGERLDVEHLRLSLGPADIETSGLLEGVGGGSPHGRLVARGRLGRTTADARLDIRWAEGRPQLDFDVRSKLVDLDEIAASIGEPSPPVRAALFFPAAWAAERSAPGGERPSWLSRVTGRGTLQADEVRLAKLGLGAVRARVRLGGGHIGIEDLAFDVCRGRGLGDFDVDLLRAGAPFELAARAEGVDVASLVVAAASSRERWLEGTGSLDLLVSGEALPGAGSRIRRGTARVSIHDGRLLSVGLMKRVGSALELAGGGGVGKEETPFDELSASFGIEAPVARTRDLLFRSRDIVLRGEGSVGFEGEVRLDAEASFSRPASEDLVRRTPQLRFRVGEDGRLTIPLQVRGTLRSPEVGLDLERVLEEGLERSLEDRGKRGWLKKLLGKRGN